MGYLGCLYLKSYLVWGRYRIYSCTWALRVVVGPKNFSIQESPCIVTHMGAQSLQEGLPAYRIMFEGVVRTFGVQVLP